jgi:hypothetical protein
MTKLEEVVWIVAIPVSSLLTATFVDAAYGWQMLKRSGGKARRGKSRMETAVWIFGTVATILFGYASLLAAFHHFRNGGIWLTCFGACSAIISLTCLLQDKAWKNAAQDSDPVFRTGYGTLEPANDSVPPGWTRSGGKKEGLTLFFGAEGAAITIPHSTSSIPLVSFMSESDFILKPLIELHLTETNAYLSGKFSDEAGKIVAAIENNTFVINDKTAFWPKRPDKHTLIVSDQSGEEILNVRYLNKNAFMYKGRVRSPDGKFSVEVTKDEIRHKSGSHNHMTGSGCGILFSERTFGVGDPSKVEEGLRRALGIQ